MPVRIVPTLAAMAEIYALPRSGGPSSERFTSYLRLVRSRERDGFQAFNPMAGEVAAATVADLLKRRAERAAAKAAAALLARCEVKLDVSLALAVASPGMWTDRLVTEAEHRLAPERRSPAVVQLWAGEPADVAAAVTAETARSAWNELHGTPRDVLGVLAREGTALALAGEQPEPADVSDALSALGGSHVWQDVLAVAYGDPLAEVLGFPPPGLPDRAGCRWATVRAAEIGAPAALRAGVSAFGADAPAP